MINEYIEKTQIAISEGLKNIKKGKLERSTYYRVLGEYFDSIYRYTKDHEDEIDDTTLARIYSLENTLKEFIVPFKIELKAPNEVLDSDEYLLETIVYFTRKQLLVKESVSFDVDNLRKYDAKANTYVQDMCKRLGLRYYSFDLGEVFNIPKKHNITLVQVNDSYYLIDCTYQQFFTLGQNFKTRYLKTSTCTLTCEVGARILGLNKDGAITLLEKGFISSDDKMFDDYFKTMLKQAGAKEPKEKYLDIILRQMK